MHIPECCGPLPPAACDVAFARAAEFFPRHFPDEPYEVAVCMSWLLDPALADHLPAESNIVRFQRRFAIVDTQESDSFERFVMPGSRLDGRRWDIGRGWLEL
nr:hypothetical protein [Allorhizocola rhizosphaerae]